MAWKNIEETCSAPPVGAHNRVSQADLIYVSMCKVVTVGASVPGLVCRCIVPLQYGQAPCHVVLLCKHKGTKQHLLLTVLFFFRLF